MSVGGRDCLEEEDGAEEMVTAVDCLQEIDGADKRDAEEDSSEIILT